MKIILVGGGKVGTALARQLSEEDHNVTIVDTNKARVEHLTESYDVLGIVGNGSSITTLAEAGIEDADVFIAVTGSDELNLLCCMFAKKAGHCHAIARVRNPSYSHELDFIKKQIGISAIINPEMAAAKEISHLLRFPGASKIDTFADGRVRLIKFALTAEQGLDGVAIREIPTRLKSDILVCAVERSGGVIIPNGNFVLQAGDKINLTASHSEIEKFFRTIGLFRTGVKSVMILGGGRMAYYLAKALILSHVRVKIIELDYKRCEYLCEALPEAVVIHGDGTDKETLQEEGLEKTDALVCLTGMDEENIVVALYAKAKKVSKVIAKINRISFDEILDALDIDGFISPKMIAANNIVRYVRAMQNSAGSSNVETLHKLVNEQIEALEFKVREKSSVVGVPLKDLKTKSEVLVATIIRNGRVIIPGGNDMIEVDDSVIIITRNKHLTDLKDILK